MSAPSGNGIAGFRVIYPDAALEEARRLGEGLSGVADRRRFAAALRVIHTRLRNDPLVFGEHLFSLSSALTVRVGGKAPLLVRFAVHAEQRYIYVYEFHMPIR